MRLSPGGRGHSLWALLCPERFRLHVQHFHNYQNTHKTTFDLTVQPLTFLSSNTVTLHSSFALALWMQFD